MLTCWTVSEVSSFFIRISCIGGAYGKDIDSWG